MSYSPNLPIGSGWKSTLQNAFQVLRRIKFIVDEDFKWTDFDPQLDFGTMTPTNINIYEMRGMRVGNTFFFHGQVVADLAAVFTNAVKISIPYSISTTVTGGSQGGGIPVLNAGAWEAGWWNANANENTIFIRRGNLGNYTLGTFQFILSGFVEVR